LLTDPSLPNTLYLTEDEDCGFYGLLRSTDGGAGWSTLWNNGMGAGIEAMVIDSTNATFYAGIGDAYAVSPDSGVFKSTDGGVTWINRGLRGAAVNLLAIALAQPGVVYAATEGPGPRTFQGLFKSIDGGASWAAITGLEDLIASRFHMTALVVDPGNSSVVYAGTSGGTTLCDVGGGKGA
jgi:hypothetical protein